MRDELLPRFTSIPAGEFTMGADDGDEDERPAHRVAVDAFALSVHAITIEQYAEFVRQTSHPPPAVRELPRLVSGAHEPSFRELASADAWQDGAPPRHRTSVDPTDRPDLDGQAIRASPTRRSSRRPR